MKKTAIIAIAGLATVASSDVLLEIDLGTVDTITITATMGFSSADASGSDGIGVLMADFYNSAAPGIVDTLVSGDLVAAGDSSDGSQNLFNSMFGSSFGLNFWGWTTSISAGFTTGTTAFTGSATWSVDAPSYASLLAGNLGGDIYAFADDDGDIGDAGVNVIGQWRVVPAPGSLALLGLGGIVAGRRRR